MPQQNVVWVASYPKSGNTWARFLACNLLYGRQESASALNFIAPDVHEMSAPQAGAFAGGLVKTHFAFDAAMPFADRTAGAIYVVRQPADVLLSNFHYGQRMAGKTDSSSRAFDDYFDKFLANRGDPRWIQLGMGSWDANINSWLDRRHPFPVLAIRYEDLAADPGRACRTIASLLKPSAADSQVASAVANSSFERMREIEEADIREKRVGIFYKPYLESSIQSGNRFMRRGGVGEGQRRLSAGQSQRLFEAFGPVMTRLGYPVELLSHLQGC